jgi:hypothetical protein
LEFKESPLSEILVACGYKLVECLEKARSMHVHSRRRSHASICCGTAQRPHNRWMGGGPQKVKAFRHISDHYEIELEPGGSELSGHFLHYIKAESTR